MLRDELKEFRKKKQLTQVEFAELLGFSKSTVCVHERGKCKNHIDYTKRINRVFKTKFPLLSECNKCGREFAGDGMLCPRCSGVGFMSKSLFRKDPRELVAVAWDAQKRGISYGNFVAGTNKKKISSQGSAPKVHKAPAYLELGRVIRI